MAVLGQGLVFRQGLDSRLLQVFISPILGSCSESRLEKM
jgi:hypothetical protein